MKAPQIPKLSAYPGWRCWTRSSRCGRTPRLCRTRTPKIPSRNSTTWSSCHWWAAVRFRCLRRPPPSAPSSSCPISSRCSHVRRGSHKKLASPWPWYWLDVGTYGPPSLIRTTLKNRRRRWLAALALIRRTSWLLSGWIAETHIISLWWRIGARCALRTRGWRPSPLIYCSCLEWWGC